MGATVRPYLSHFWPNKCHSGTFQSGRRCLQLWTDGQWWYLYGYGCCQSFGFRNGQCCSIGLYYNSYKPDLLCGRDAHQHRSHRCRSRWKCDLGRIFRRSNQIGRGRDRSLHICMEQCQLGDTCPDSQSYRQPRSDFCFRSSQCQRWSAVALYGNRNTVLGRFFFRRLQCHLWNHRHKCQNYVWIVG